MKAKHYETHTRSLLKAITFRVIVLMVDFTIVITITHRYDVAIGFVILSNITSTAIYFLHERLWNNIKWGLKA